jgi:hypothetical protein
VTKEENETYQRAMDIAAAPSQYPAWVIRDAIHALCAIIDRKDGAR